MNYKSFIKTGLNVLGLILFKKRCPLAVSWALTYRCNGDCLYCHLSVLEKKELGTAKILSILDQLKQAGTKFIAFTGGEPLLRNDIETIIERAVSLGMNVVVNTNGRLVPEKFTAIRNISLLRISLDGPQAINDSIRGKGSFDSAIEALKISKQAGLRAQINTVISKNNAKYIPQVIDICKKLDIGVSFQPATRLVFGEKIMNPISASSKEYQAAINFLINQKLKGCRIILNSLPALKYLHYWPKKRKLNCAAGLLACRIEPDGELFACGGKPVMDLDYGIGLKEYSFDKAFRLLKKPPCDGCWCNIWLDFNLLRLLNPIVSFKIIKERLS